MPVENNKHGKIFENIKREKILHGGFMLVWVPCRYADTTARDTTSGNHLLFDDFSCGIFFDTESQKYNNTGIKILEIFNIQFFSQLQNYSLSRGSNTQKLLYNKEGKALRGGGHNTDRKHLHLFSYISSQILTLF